MKDMFEKNHTGCKEIKVISEKMIWMKRESGKPTYESLMFLKKREEKWEQKKNMFKDLTKENFLK